MKHLLPLLAIVIFVSCGPETSELSAEDGELTLGVTRSTSSGTVIGVLHGGVYAFKGIPYAAPPSGAARFRKPAPPASWSGLLTAFDYGPACPQRLDHPADDTHPEPWFEVIGEEDCLFTNVWTPARDASARLPVMVWIHGGGYTSGAGGGFDPWRAYGLSAPPLDLYEGDELARNGNVVVVSFNYRLGALGFLASPSLTAEGGTSGNFGAYDIIAALEWVAQNAARFGGDPARVTLFGESAGAWSVCSLLASPLARGLFSAAAAQSMYCVNRTLAEAEVRHTDYVSRVVARTGCSGAPAACLRSAPVEVLLAEQGGEVLNPSGFTSVESVFDYVPLVDGGFLTEPAFAAIRGGRHSRVPVIAGGTAEEGSFVRLLPGLPETFEALAVLIRAAPWPADVEEALVAFYGPEHFPNPRQAIVAFGTDLFMTCPQRQLIRALDAAQTQPVFRYIFDAGVPAFGGLLDLLGSFHGAELFFLFQRIDQLPLGTPRPLDFVLESDMVRAWSAFARTGSPATLVRPWPEHHLGSNRLLRWSTPSSVVTGFHDASCDAFDRVEPPLYPR